MVEVTEIFELKMEEEDYQFMLEIIEKEGYYVLPVFKGIEVRNQGEF